MQSHFPFLKCTPSIHTHGWLAQLRRVRVGLTMLNNAKWWWRLGINQWPAWTWNPANMQRQTHCCINKKPKEKNNNSYFWSPRRGQPANVATDDSTQKIHQLQQPHNNNAIYEHNNKNNVSQWRTTPRKAYHKEASNIGESQSEDHSCTQTLVHLTPTLKSEDCGHLCCTEAWTRCRIIFSVGCMWPNQPIPPFSSEHICKKLDNARLQQPHTHTYLYGKDRTDGRMDETHSPAPIQAEQHNWRKLSLHECWWLAGWAVVLLHHSCIPCHSK